MSLTTIIDIIGLIIAPAVMISSCAIFLNGIITRYESVGTRMRMMHHERLELLHGLGQTTHNDIFLQGYNTHRIDEIEVQLPLLLHRHKLLRNAVVTENTAIGFFVISMFIIAVAAITHSTIIATTALCIFLVGTGALLAGIIITAVELSGSHHEVAYEIQDGLKLRKEDLM